MRIKEVIPVYLRHLKTLGRPYNTIKGTKYGLKSLVKFLEGENILHLGKILALTYWRGIKKTWPFV
ncbi:MAG: hypothetical protein SV775_15915 [Thermodesulfobacteriota bacterium]|nr:hypothetical protein [Thermodesulfobacteriota bacterium]